ncbi:cell surface A33 antigen [Gracilinanus agilis]|uniref:cell surface A33 antigen n=1 Tax=Gracilinanus agilis TaxID=191870 RepID=UPI001CFF29B7|nr:cell surface A33 antigen [Gracilinanus agilis]
MTLTRTLGISADRRAFTQVLGDPGKKDKQRLMGWSQDKKVKNEYIKDDDGKPETERRRLKADPAYWGTSHAITVETPSKVLRVARDSAATLPCSYKTTLTARYGFIQWDKPLTTPPGQHHGDYRLEKVAPSIPDCGIEGETVYGNNIQLTCQSKEGSPAPQYSWKGFDVENKERPLSPPVTGKTLLLKNISADTSGYYICTATNEMGTKFCNITVAVRPPSMNIALYAGIAGGVVAALIIIGIIVYCCCCKGSEEKDSERPNREDYQEPSEKTEMQRRRNNDDEEGGNQDRWSSGQGSPTPSTR